MFIRLYFVILVLIVLNDLHKKAVVICISTLNGRYTKGIEGFDLTVPHKLTSTGEFESFKLPHFVDHDTKRKKRDLDKDKIHYGVHLNGQLHHVELTPNHDFLSPNLVVEHRDPTVKVQDKSFRKLEDTKMCHFTGKIRSVPDSKAALSTCHGLAGYVSMDNKRYFIEPVEEHEPNSDGQHLHVVYSKEPHKRETEQSKCGTTENWEEVWKKRFLRKIAEGTLALPRRGLESEHRYLETLVVCDKQFLEHHKNSDYETYVMTVMNMVADYYHDASSGNQMDVVIVRIIYLEKEEEEIDLVINADADKTLASFCKWQVKINPKDKENPNHHDIAVLLTRYDICADNMSNCGLMGLAYVASACTGDEPCAINEDGGLNLGIVVAHEMGHVMGCSHDKEGESTCPAQDKDDSFFVMAPYVHLFTTKWSTCSRGFITALFENGLGDCLNDKPEDTLYPFKNILPGTVYDADAQCNIIFPNSEICLVDKEKFCELLLCKVSPTSCMSKDEPVADGTKCGENKWCYRKQCVEIGERPEAINGGWGEWGSWSQCSRTCGTGISIAERECNNPVPQNRGRYCIGDRKKIKTCNVDPCPEGMPSFREVQCTETNREPFNDRFYTWTPYIKEGEPCVLYCLNQENVFVKRKPRVKDGTICKPGTKDICVAGVCTNIGCDNQLNSDAVEDVCGICNGDGTQCKIIDEVYNDLGAHDYKKVATIPEGSRKIVIDELAPSENTIAISDKTEKRFYLNGNHNEDNDGVKMIGDVEGLYSHTEPGRENFVINGPLKEDIILWVVFYKQENVGYQYRYAELSRDLGYRPSYHWELLEWADCSAKCDGGYQMPIYDCVEERSGKVSPNFCQKIEKPQSEPKKCNERPCKRKWKVGKWGPCQACRDKSGVRIREVECIKESSHPGAQDVLVEDKECKEPRPGSRELCNAHKTCSKKRHTDNLPDDLMEKVWMQTNRKSINKRESFKNNVFKSRQCLPETSTSCEKITLNVGQVIKDHVPDEEIKLIKIPFKQSHLTLNISDNAFETMGDSMADTLDLSNAKIITGEKASKLLKKLGNPNNTGTL